MWVLRIPKALLRRMFEDEEDGLDSEEQLQVRLGRMERAEEECEGEKMALLECKLSEQKDMNGFCDAFRDAGAVFYEDLRDCPEAVELGLLEPKMGRNDWVPPGDLWGKWEWRDGT